MVRRVISALFLVAAVNIAVAAPAQAAPCGYQGEAAPSPKISATSWAQRQLGLDRVHQLQAGAGVRVAVIDTGVDANHPQLANAVAQGWDSVNAENAGRADCNSASHGTAVASIIAARPDANSSLVGVAPAATIVPIRIADSTPAPLNPVLPSGLAAAIRQAITLRSNVIHVSYALLIEDADLRGAVNEALGAGIVIVAAAGEGTLGTTYPAGYEGVVGVGALAKTGERLTSSSAGSHVDMMAPGEQVVAAARVSGHTVIGGTAAAAAQVSGTAALLRSAYPKWTPKQVVQQLIATADGTNGGPVSGDFGFGCVNPYRAITEQTAFGAGPSWVPLPQGLTEAPPQPQWPAMWRHAAFWAAGLILLAILTGVVRAVALSYQQRHRITG